MFRNALVMLLVTVGVVAAQEAPAMSQHFKPGDSLHYYIRFEGNPELSKVAMYFGLTGESKKNQTGLSSTIDLGEARRVSAGLYEVNGKIKEIVASGTYRLIQVAVVHPPTSRTYNYPQDFSENITIEVVNDTGYEFPAIKSITPSPPK